MLLFRTTLNFLLKGYSARSGIPSTPKRLSFDITAITAIMTITTIALSQTSLDFRSEDPLERLPDIEADLASTNLISNNRRECSGIGDAYLISALLAPINTSNAPSSAIHAPVCPKLVSKYPTECLFSFSVTSFVSPGCKNTLPKA